MALFHPDADQVRTWLEQSNIEHYVCDQCHGLHLSSMQATDAVLDCRLFVEDDFLLLSSELELRPAAQFAVLADLPRLSTEYPALKVFPDVNDTALPCLVVSDVLYGRQGLAFDQFVHFVQATLDATTRLSTECEQLNYLFWPEEDNEPLASALH